LRPDFADDADQLFVEIRESNATLDIGEIITSSAPTLRQWAAELRMVLFADASLSTTARSGLERGADHLDELADKIAGIGSDAA
jgi:hypothetical protein